MNPLRPLGTARTIFVLLSLLVLLPVAAGTLRQVSAQSEESGEDSLYKHLSVFTEVLSLIQRSYVDDANLERLFAGALEGATDALDALATYVPAPEVEDYRQALEVGTDHSGLTVAREIGISFTVAVEPGSPGEQAGVQPGDVIAEVNGRSTREMALWELQTLLAAGSTSLEMKLLRQGKSVDVELSLGPFTREIPSVVVEEGIPVLRIAAFTGATSGQVAALLSAPNIADSDRLVLDVRGVAGGTVEAAFDVAGFFMQGPLGELRDRSGSIASYTGEAQPQWSGRMAILVDRGCQGPCEVLTAALKDAPGIEIVGAPTFGLAGRFASREMSTGATLFFTDAFYAGPDGEPIDSSLEPEVGVQASRQTLGGVENLPADPVLQRALDLLREEERQAA